MTLDNKMKCLLLLTFVALSCASSFYSTSKSINIEEDGTIVITGANGKRVVISKIIDNPDERFIDISVEGPYLPTKKIRIDGQGPEMTVDVQNGPYTGRFKGLYWEDDMEGNTISEVATAGDSKQPKSQADLLYTIFKDYQGIVDDESYETLLKKVYEYVGTGELDSSVYDVLKYLHDQKPTQEQSADFARVPLVRSDITSTFRDTLANKYQQPTSVLPAIRPFYEQLYAQQGSQPWIQKQDMNGQWVRNPDQWSQQTWQWNSQQQPQGPWDPQQQWVSQQQPVVPRLWGSEQPQWGTGQQQWMPQQQWISPQWVPQQSNAEQLRSSYNIWMPYVLNRKWNQQKQSLDQGSSLWPGWNPQQQWISEQWIPEQQNWMSEQLQPVSQQQWVPQVTEEQRPAYNPWIAPNLNQIWNQSWDPQSSYPMRDRPTVDYPWQRASLNRGLVY